MSGSGAPEDLLRIAEAAVVLGVHQQTLRRWADAGTVPVVRMPSGQRRFRRSDLQSILDAGGVS